MNEVFEIKMRPISEYDGTDHEDYFLFVRSKDKRLFIDPYFSNKEDKVWYDGNMVYPFEPVEFAFFEIK